MKLYSKEELIKEIRKIFDAGWHKSVKKTINTRNDGAVGNTLERLLHIKENNLPIPNAQEWELKGQRSHTGSLITLKHIEPTLRVADKLNRVGLGIDLGYQEIQKRRMSGVQKELIDRLL